MEMCYNGALVMPSSFAAITADEMEYLTGGAFYINTDSCNRIAAVCAAVGVGAGCVGDVLGIIALVNPEAISKGAAIAIYAICAAAKLISGAASAFFWYASARGGITIGWFSFKFGR